PGVSMKAWERKRAREAAALGRRQRATRYTSGETNEYHDHQPTSPIRSGITGSQRTDAHRIRRGRGPGTGRRGDLSAEAATATLVDPATIASSRGPGSSTTTAPSGCC